MTRGPNAKNRRIIDAMKTFLVNERGFSIDRYGNCINNEKTRRYHFNSISCRIEIKLSTGRWHRVGGYYYKDICSINGENISEIIQGKETNQPGDK